MGLKLIARLARALGLMAAFAVAAPVAAQTAPVPEQHRNVDQFGVDQVTGSYNLSITEGEIGPDDTGIRLIRYWTRGGWRDNWSGDLRRTAEGSTQVATITFGNQSERFTLVGGAWVSAAGNGGSLNETTANRVWQYRAPDGTAVTYETPLPASGPPTTISMPWGYCSSANAIACGIPKIVQRPDGLVYTLTWQITQQFNYNPTFNSNVGYRLSDVRSSTGYGIKIKYQSNEGGGQPFGYQGETRTEWTNRISYRFFDLSQVICSPTANDCDSVAGSWPVVSYSYAAPGVLDIVNTQSGTIRVTTNGTNVVAVRRPGATADTTTVAYDGSNRVTAVTDEGVTRTYNWTTSGTAVTVVATDGGAGGGSTTTVSSTVTGQPTSVTNATSNSVTYVYDANGRVTRETRPEGDYTQITYDSRGNVTETRLVAKPGSGLADIVASASYSATCSNPATCNQPIYTIEALGNQTDYTYDATHGQVTRVQLPAPTTGGARPEVNYSYSQLQAQVMGTGGVLVDSGQPQWLLTEVRRCNSAATCAGTANETRTTITYSPTNNLNVASVTTAAGDGSTSSTTAYAYDARDNLLSVDGPLPGNADTTYFVNDSSDRRIGVIGPDPDGAGARTRVGERYAFDSASRVIVARQTG